MASSKPNDFNLEKLQNFPARETFVPALKIGAFTGTAGLLTGGASSIFLSSKTPALFTLASSLQCFLLGSTFWVTRSTILYIWSPPAIASLKTSRRLQGTSLTPQDRVYASTFAGGITGGIVGGLIRGRRNILPATLMWTIFGYAGQKIFDRLDAKHSEQVAIASEERAASLDLKKEKGFWDRMAEREWSPMKTLSDEDYSNMLRKKMLVLEAEIALVDEEVERLRVEEQMQEQDIHGQGKEEVKK